MDRAVLQKQLLKLVGLHAPIKARSLAKILADEFGKHVDRSDVNSVLYALKAERKVEVNAGYEWSIYGQLVAEKSRSDRNVAEVKLDMEAEERVVSPEIIFTPDQQAVINLDPVDHLLIRGQAGSGKTTVLAARAGRILSAMNKGSLLFLTYNSALSAYVKKTFKKSGMKSSIAVQTFHEWSRNCVKALGFEFGGWVDDKARSQKILQLIDVAIDELGNHRLYDLKQSPELLTWWGDEIAWLFGQHLMRLDDYLSVERTGRGTSVRVSQEDRRFVWYVFELYEEWLEDTRQADYDNPAGLILRALQEEGKNLPDELRFDHVMIDEVQDFDKSWLLVAVKIPRVSLSMAGDLAQKIYKRSFSWSSVGIQVQGGRSRRLPASHRTTKQIMDVAAHLLINNDVTDSTDYTAPERPVKSGDKVKMIVGANPKDAYDKGYDWIFEQFKRLRSTTVAVVLPFSRQMYPAKMALEKRGLKVQSVKGAGLGGVDGGVVVTTFHQLKGLEFDHVVIMGLHDAQYPCRLLERLPQEDHSEEISLMKRVLYVAMTRAKKSVSLVGSKPFCRFFDGVPANLIDEI
ncbi:DNA helicase [Bacterioplanes sanyensis]|uniref:3'-5' exonuclease n=1 Tax=Bacterioplanes sanyensis TaxID=1249553 RepID=UPI00167924F6|nr:3'-5' exonuclease [Bacterioplanes sanyensis]GGY39063.1 DNA helicase [Bacterioplanes sanyensis]